MYGLLMLFEQNLKRTNVIRVLVGDKNGINIAKIKSNGAQCLTKRTGALARVNEDFCLFGFNEDAVAL
jgi:hypothetical protein